MRPIPHTRFQFPVEIKMKTERWICFCFFLPSASQQEVAWLRDRRVTNPVTANILSSSETERWIEDPQQSITRLDRSDMEMHGSIVRGRNVCLPVRSNTTCRRAEESCSLARENNKRRISLSLPGFIKPVGNGPVWPVKRSGSGLGRYQTGPNSKFKIEFKKMKNSLKISKNTSRCDESNGVKFSQKFVRLTYFWGI